jgi:chromosome segregation ATPase
MSDLTNESNEQRDRAIDNEKKLQEKRKEVEAMEGENADLTETVEAMEKNMAAVRTDFSSRMDAAREETISQKELYEERLDKLQVDLDAKTKESREAVYQHDVAESTIRKLEKELEIKGNMLDQVDKEQESLRGKYEGRIDRIREEMQNMKEEHLNEIGSILEENEGMKRDLNEERSGKRTAEYRCRRLEEEVETGKALVEQARKDAEDSKEEYEHVMENVMMKSELGFIISCVHILCACLVCMSCAHIPPNTSYLMLIFTVNEAKDEADAKSEEISELQSQIRKAAIEKRRADDKIELLEGDKEALESKVAKFQDEMDKTIGDYETRIDSKFLSVALSFLPSLYDVRIDQYLPPQSLLSLF